jgi:hypothetical protein
MKMDKYEKAALKLVNQIRKLQGKEKLERLLVGDVGEATSCPIANSINGYADDSEIKFKLPLIGEVEINTPNLVDEFVNRFDDEYGEHPYTHLMSKASLKEYKERLKEEAEYAEKEQD